MIDKNIENKAKSILDSMSLIDKIGQVTQIIYSDESIEDMKKLLDSFRPGSLILCGSALGGNDKQRSVCVDNIRAIQEYAVNNLPAHIPLLFGRDVIHGHRVAFPVPLTMASSFDFDLIEKSYGAIRDEALNDGVNWTFSPMLDLSREPRWGRIVEGTGEDPYIGRCFAKASVNGIQVKDGKNSGLLACAKHFVGYGASEGGRDYNHTEISDYSLNNYYLPAFRSAIENNVATMMSSFNDVNAIPVTGSRKLLTDVLREQLGFDGFVVSDWNGIRQMSDFSGFAVDLRDCAKKAITAGVDMDMVCNCYFDNIESLINDGEISIDTLDNAVLRIIYTKLKFGIFENPYPIISKYDINEHLKLSKKLAEESIVLLKNNDNILPLSKDSTVAIADEMFFDEEELVGTWSLDYDVSLISKFDTAISNVAPNAKIIKTKSSTAYYLLNKNNADCVIVFLGEQRDVTGEARCISDISVPVEQIEYIKKIKQSGKKVIGVLCYARPVVLGEANELLDAILYCGHGGTNAAEAVINILFGKSTPQGRLPFTLPLSQGQLPLYYNALPGSRKINGYYGDINYNHGNYVDISGAPLYPFGYGLSYTEFVTSNPVTSKKEYSIESLKKGEKILIEATVSNVGNHEGKYVAQLYINSKYNSFLRPIKSLCQHCIVSLSPGESKNVQLYIGYSDLGSYSDVGKFLVEGGKYTFYFGENSLTENSISVTIN